MVTVCVKINRIVMYIIFSIITLALLLLILSVFKGGGKKATSPEVFLGKLGYNYKLIDEKRVAIPKNFGENMKKYNELQKRQGFDLKDYAGKICTQKKYAITDFGNSKIKKNCEKPDDEYIADLIVFDGVVVGGNLHSKSYGSELKELRALRK